MRRCEHKAEIGWCPCPSGLQVHATGQDARFLVSSGRSKVTACTLQTKRPLLAVFSRWRYGICAAIACATPATGCQHGNCEDQEVWGWTQPCRGRHGQKKTQKDDCIMAHVVPLDPPAWEPFPRHRPLSQRPLGTAASAALARRSLLPLEPAHLSAWCCTADGQHAGF